MTFTQLRNRVMMHFSERITVVKRRMTIYLQGPWLGLLWTNSMKPRPWYGVVVQHIPVLVDANPYSLYLFFLIHFYCHPFLYAFIFPSCLLNGIFNFLSLHGCYVSYPSNHPWIGHRNICWRVQFMQFSPSPVTFLFVCREGYLHNFT